VMVQTFGEPPEHPGDDADKSCSDVFAGDPAMIPALTG